MDYKKVLDHLYSLEISAIELGLDRIQNLLNKIGNPEKELKCIHVAGTNGKGSTCAMLQSIFMSASYKTGMYTSPHLKRFNERIRINDKLITDKEIVEIYLKVKPYVTNQSFFEITTAMAFLYFYKKKCDYVILEVGLGGRLDATNVIVPLVSIITNISLEHTHILGDSEKKIAFEKAGIIKRNVPVVTGASSVALKVIDKTAKQRKAPLYRIRKYPHANLKYLGGQYQQLNKDMVLTAINILKKYHRIKITKVQIANGLINAKWPGRMQFVSKNVLFDGAHNPAGINILKNELLFLKKRGKFTKFIFVIGIKNTKDVPQMLNAISELASTIVFTRSTDKHSIDPKKLQDEFNKMNKKSPSLIIETPKKALDHAKKVAKNSDLVVACGSLYLLGDLM